MAPSTIAGFTTIPIEIRREIYSYLLLSFNAVMTREVCQVQAIENPKAVVEDPHISTALFTTSAMISHETLEYFYRENAFVAVRTNIPKAVKICMLLFPGFLWTPKDCTDAVLSEKKRQCLGKIGLVVDINLFLSRYQLSYEGQLFSAEPWVFIFNLRYLATVLKILNASHAQDFRKQDIVMHLDYCSVDAVDRGCPKVHKTIVNALQTLRSDFKDDGIPYLTLVVNGFIKEQEAASLRATQLSRYSTIEMFKDCEWALALGDKEKGQGNIKRAENYYHAVNHFLWISDPSDEGRRQLKFQRCVLSMEMLLRLAATSAAAKEYRIACAYASDAGYIALQLDVSPEEEMDMRTHYLYRVGCILASSGGSEREHNLHRAVAVLHIAMRNHTDPALGQEIQARIHGVSLDLNALGVRLEDHETKQSIKLIEDNYLQESRF